MWDVFAQRPWHIAAMRIEKIELILMLAALAEKAADQGDQNHAASLWSQTRNHLESLVRETKQTEGAEAAAVQKFRNVVDGKIPDF